MTLAPNTAYKVLSDGKSCHGGNLDWSLPTLNEDGTYTPGAWMRVDGELILCENAIHLTDQPAAWYVEGGQCWLAEYRGATVGALDGGTESKLGVREARLLAPVEWATVGAYTTGEHTVSAGFVLASDSATVRAYGSATVRAYGSATVHAYGSATVRAYGSATVHAYDSATVHAYGSATVISSRWHSANATVVLTDLAAHVDRRGGAVAVRVAEVSP